MLVRESLLQLGRILTVTCTTDLQLQEIEVRGHDGNFSSSRPIKFGCSDSSRVFVRDMKKFSVAVQLEDLSWFCGIPHANTEKPSWRSVSPTTVSTG
jgi:hypothetical protein